jgi:branched-subunit amino acid aminotransferase/4-amino-4-deoxychorismate lyase
MQAVVVGPPRNQADFKDTNWVRVRKPLAQKVPEDAAEGLLQDERGRLLEGLVTNFFVINAPRMHARHAMLRPWPCA